MEVRSIEQKAIDFIESLSSENREKLEGFVKILNQIQKEIRLRINRYGWSSTCLNCSDNCCSNLVSNCMSENELIFIFLSPFSEKIKVLLENINYNNSWECLYLSPNWCIFPFYARPQICFFYFCDKWTKPYIAELHEMYENVYFNMFESFVESIRLGLPTWH